MKNWILICANQRTRLDNWRTFWAWKYDYNIVHKRKNLIKKILYFAVILLLASSAFAQANLESSVISSTGTLDATNGTSALHYLIGQSVIGTAELPAGNAIEIGAIYGFIIGFPPITSGGGIVAKCREFNNNTMTTLSKKTFKVTMDGGAPQSIASDASGNLIMTNIAPGIHQLTLVYNNGTDDFKVMINY